MGFRSEPGALRACLVPLEVVSRGLAFVLVASTSLATAAVERGSTAKDERFCSFGLVLTVCGASVTSVGFLSKIWDDLLLSTGSLDSLGIPDDLPGVDANGAVGGVSMSSRTLILLWQPCSK